MGIEWNRGRDPFNQNFRAEVRKFLGVEWIATGPNGLDPFPSQKESARALLQNGGSRITVSNAGV